MPQGKGTYGSKVGRPPKKTKSKPVESMSEEKTSAFFQGSPEQVAGTMKRNPSFKKGMEEYYGVTLGDDDKIKAIY